MTVMAALILQKNISSCVKYPIKLEINDSQIGLSNGEEYSTGVKGDKQVYN